MIQLPFRPARQLLPSLLVQLLQEGQALHGPKLRVFCENYPMMDWSRYATGATLPVAPASFTQYEDILGDEHLRAALAERDAQRLHLPLTLENVAITCGATHALHVALQTMGRPGMAVYLPAPGFTGYRDIGELLGLICRPYALSSYASWDPQALFDTIRGPAILVLNTPHNPTGSVLREAQVRDIAHRAAQAGTIVIVDRVYDSLLYDSPALRWDAIGQGRESSANFVFINSFSKNYGLPGLRLGWITAAPERIKMFGAVIERNLVCVSGFNQRFALQALSWDMEGLVAELRGRRDNLCHLLGGIRNVTFSLPEGGTTLWLRLQQENGLRLARKLLHDHAVVLLPGEGYYGGDPQTLRLSFGYPLTDIEYYTGILRRTLGSRDPDIR
jgi:aminotransferase